MFSAERERWCTDRSCVLGPCPAKNPRCIHQQQKCDGRRSPGSESVNCTPSRMKIRGLPESERLAVRQQRSKVLLTSLHEWMVEKNGTLSKKSRLGEAFSYVLNQWDALCYYSDDGLAEADNNAAERALRAVCLGKKNFMFFGSDHGGERGALLYGLIGTCRLNGIDPEAYLRHILSVLPEWPSNRVDELLPWNVVLTNK
ncbi:IS66 family transposase [Escherichia coli]|uniref:IS66 family transposase n=1 Tax=Escherichia coli TaxID=562 RepID=UPI0021C0C1FD|nr:transposase [Escherichia coli]UXL27036.1 transposase [Escherichia coli]